MQHALDNWFWKYCEACNKQHDIILHECRIRPIFPLSECLRLHIVSHEMLTSSLCVHLLFSQRIWVVLSSLQRVAEWLVQLICFCWVHFFFIDFWSGQAVAWRDSCLKLTALIVCCTGLGLPPFFIFFSLSLSLFLKCILFCFPISFNHTISPNYTQPASHFNNCNIATVHKDNQVCWLCMCIRRVCFYITTLSMQYNISLVLRRN